MTWTRRPVPTTDKQYWGLRIFDQLVKYLLVGAIVAVPLLAGATIGVVFVEHGLDAASGLFWLWLFSGSCALLAIVGNE